MATWIHIFSGTLLNEARFSFTRFHDDEFSILDKASLAIPKLDTNGFNFAGGPGLGLPGGGSLQYGIDRSVPKILVENTYEIRDTVSKQLGNKFEISESQIIRRES